MSLSLIYNVSFAALTVLALTLTFVSVLAYKRSKKKKLLLVSMAFIFFFFKGIWLSSSLFIYPADAFHFVLVPVAIFDCIILILLYLSIVKG